MTNKKMTSWPRRMTVIALMVGLLTTGGLATREPDRAFTTRNNRGQHLHLRFFRIFT